MWGRCWVLGLYLKFRNNWGMLWEAAWCTQGSDGSSISDTEIHFLISLTVISENAWVDKRKNQLCTWDLEVTSPPENLQEKYYQKQEFLNLIFEAVDTFVEQITFVPKPAISTEELDFCPWQKILPLINCSSFCLHVCPFIFFFYETVYQQNTHFLNFSFSS